MKIGICCYPTYGGSGAVATELGLRLAERGHEVHFISYAQPFRLDRFRERVFFHEVEMAQYPLFEYPPYSLALAVAVHATAREHDLDLVHVHYAIPHAASAWIARRMLAETGADLPVVTTLHGTDITLLGVHPAFQSITSFSIRRSQGITAVSRWLADETARDFDVDPERIDVIPNFIDPELYRPGIEPCHRATLAPGGERILMHVSNFRPVKRVPDCVEILARVRRELPARLVLVGDGPERPRVQERARRLGVEDHVVFLGKHQSVHELLACADLFLLPSETESFGLAALEAMACGVPVVASSVGGLPEVVPTGEGGFLRPVGDVDAMAADALTVLGDDAVGARMRSGAREHAVSRFGAAQVVPRYEAHYRRVLGGDGP